MRIQIRKVIDNLTDQYVPDKYSEISAVIENKPCAIPEDVERILTHRKPIIFKYVGVCVSLLLIVGLSFSFNLLNKNGFLNLGQTPPNLVENNSPTTDSMETASNSDTPIQNSNPINDDTVFNVILASPNKIGGIVKSVLEDEWKNYFTVNSLAYDLNYKFLYHVQTEISSNSKPIAGILDYFNSDTSWFKIYISKTEKLQDFILNNPTITKIENCEVVFATYQEKARYALFSYNDCYYFIESEGFTENDMIELVKQLIL